MFERVRNNSRDDDLEMPFYPDGNEPNGGKSDSQSKPRSTGYAIPFPGAPLFQRYTRYTSEYADQFKETTRQAQLASPPLFVPSLPKLRRFCIEDLGRRLQNLEHAINTETAPTVKSRQRIDEAIRLMGEMDRLVDSEAQRLRMEDPEYASSRGLRVVHFESKIRDSRNWMMLSKEWGDKSRSIIDSDTTTILTEYHQHELKKFASKKFVDVDDLKDLRVWSQRPKTTEERRWKSLKYELDGSVMLNYRWARIWNIVLYVVVAALMCFYGVGIIATNTRFSPTFQQYFFWIAIFWSLISSGILSWLVIALGATRRDSVGAFLTGLGLWLVVIQIGQTHLAAQQSEERSQNANGTTY